MRVDEVLNNLFHLQPDVANPRFVIFTPSPGNRLDYVCRFIFHQHFRSPFIIVTQLDEINSTDILINYSETELPGAFQIVPAGVLSNDQVPVEPVLEECDGMKTIYRSAQGHISFDIFAAVFYFISRAEEWRPFQPDTHGRFEADQSFLFRHGLHLTPLVDKWIVHFKNRLNAKQSFHLTRTPFRMISTIDVDNLYAYRHKGIVRTLGASAKDIIRFDFFSLKTRLQVLSGKQKDPFDIYEEVADLCNSLGIPLVFFFLYKTGTRHDRTVDPRTGAFREVFKLLHSKGGSIGIHPSYETSRDEHQLAAEISRIRADGADVAFSRQHYLRFDIRSTPAQLLENGIRADFTMGFATQPGFRAGTSFPFYYFDFNSNHSTSLLLVPFCAMDGAFTVYGKSDAEVALRELLILGETIRETGGFFITVFHERTFFDHLYSGYATLYKKLHEQLKP